VTFLKKILHSLNLSIQFLLVFTFILFEEVIWERLAEPIYQKIQSLKILQKLQNFISKRDRYTILIIFLFLLIGVESAGLSAGIFFFKGKIFWGTFLYMCKIPIAGFTFWLFKVSKNKLLSFNWFAWAYSKIVYGMEWIKSTDIYKSAITSILILKNRYLSKDGSILKELKLFYRYIKKLKNRKKL
jgi:hypothetical protein